jgi:malate dehydrogenase (oxaloacetate-decarboxylating)
MKDIAIHIAIKVALQAQQDGVAPKMSEQKVSDQVQKKFWIAEYRAITKSQRSKSQIR